MLRPDTTKKQPAQIDLDEGFPAWPIAVGAGVAMLILSFIFA